MVSLTQDKGGFYARKRIPNAVRAEYQRLYGQGHEVKFFLPASTPAHEARQLRIAAGDYSPDPSQNDSP
jgi:hypothetical protein